MNSYLAQGGSAVAVRAGATYMDVGTLHGYRQAMEQATGTNVDAAAEDAANFARQNDARVAENLSRVPAISRVANTIKGYVMEARDNQSQQNTSSSDTVRPEMQVVVVGVPVIALLVAWRWHRRRRGV